MSILRITGTQAGFAENALLYFLLDRTGLPQRQARTLVEDVSNGFHVEFEIYDYSDADFDSLNSLYTEFEIIR